MCRRWLGRPASTRGTPPTLVLGMANTQWSLCAFNKLQSKRLLLNPCLSCVTTRNKGAWILLHCPVVLSRDKFTKAFDAYCGVCILALYFLYLGVVKGALSVFDCTQNKDGVYILDADPSIVCDKVRWHSCRHCRHRHCHLSCVVQYCALCFVCVFGVVALF